MPKTKNTPQTAHSRQSRPSKDEILDYIQKNPTESSKNDLARVFKLQGEDRIWLKKTLATLKKKDVVRKDHKRYSAPKDTGLPPIVVLHVQKETSDGSLFAVPESWSSEEKRPLILVRTEKKSARLGDRILAQMDENASGDLSAKVLRRLEKEQLSFVAVVGEKGELKPIDKKGNNRLRLPLDEQEKQKVGDLVKVACISDPKQPLSRKTVNVIENYGPWDSVSQISTLAIHSHEIPSEFPEVAVQEAEKTGPVPLSSYRKDIRDIPLVTIDGEDARDFDDAVYAEKDKDPENSDGWKILVAIADVAHYVRPNSPLDKEAQKRGNSCYFPDQVVPMLPEALSNGWCSLNPDEDRGCLAVWVRINAQGELLSYRFFRGLMRSQARLTYTQVQEALDGKDSTLSTDFIQTVLSPLQNAYHALEKNQKKRGTLDLNIPEKKPILSPDKSKVLEVGLRERWESHKIIEAFMILANVAAALALQEKRTPGLYRTHDDPSAEKIDALRSYLNSLSIPFAKGSVIKPSSFDQVLKNLEDPGLEELISMQILRSQSKAVYSTQNSGHFGLALRNYTHFTSPIRRYADLLVHRALIGAYRLGADEEALPKEQILALDDIAEHISTTERRAERAERETQDRYLTAYLSEHVGAEFNAHISGAARGGVFLTLDENGADGLIPLSKLPDDYYIHYEAVQAFKGERTGVVIGVGDQVRVRLVDANALTGKMAFELVRILRSIPRILKREKQRGHGERGAKRNERGSKRGKSSRTSSNRRREDPSSSRHRSKNKRKK